MTDYKIRFSSAQFEGMAASALFFCGLICVTQVFAIREFEAGEVKLLQLPQLIAVVYELFGLIGVGVQSTLFMGSGLWLGFVSLRKIRALKEEISAEEMQAIRLAHAQELAKKNFMFRDSAALLADPKKNGGLSKTHEDTCSTNDLCIWWNNSRGIVRGD
jgi:hypothetical protein